MLFKIKCLTTNIKYNSNKSESKDQFFQNEQTFLFLNDKLTHSGYFAIGVKDNLSIEINQPLNPNELDEFLGQKGEWKFGFLTYDLKNDLEVLSSGNNDGLNFPKVYFFIPETLLKYKNGRFELVYGNEKYISQIKTILDTHGDISQEEIELKSSLSKESYLSKIIKLQEEIQQGNIYEVNFCYEFYAEQAKLDPLSLFHKLMLNSNAPFSSFGKFNDKYVISASPERFLKKEGAKLVSQPIKGTAKRGKSEEEDARLKEELLGSEKERSENIMIVDLVRNDFSRIGKFDSVLVEELCKIYSFKTVHQMVSTISCELKEGVRFSEVLKATFPMGSMTGAPKISAMKLIEREEETKRGLYSGSIGYVTPDGDFDFNVIIRTFLYNESKKYLSAMVGGAITSKSSPEDEYEETLIKISALLKSLKL